MFAYSVKPGNASNQTEQLPDVFKVFFIEHLSLILFCSGTAEKEKVDPYLV